MADFKPVYPGYGVASGVIGGDSEQKAPETKLPEAGDTMKIAVNPWGQFQIVDADTRIGEGSKLIEVTVTSVKAAVVTFE